MVGQCSCTARVFDFCKFRMLFQRIQMAQLTHVYQCMLQTRALQQLRDSVGNISLRNAVQRNRHIGLGECDFLPVHLHILQTDFVQSSLHIRSNIAARVLAEMFGITLPQHLHRRVKRTVGQRMDALALAQQGQQIRRRRVQAACTVQTRYLTIALIHTENLFQTRNFRQRFINQPLGHRTVRVIQAQLRIRAQCNALPNNRFSGFALRCTGRQQRSSRNSSSDTDKTTTCDLHNVYLIFC